MKEKMTIKKAIKVTRNTVANGVDFVGDATGLAGKIAGYGVYKTSEAIGDGVKLIGIANGYILNEAGKASNRGLKTLSNVIRG